MNDTDLLESINSKSKKRNGTIRRILLIGAISGALVTIGGSVIKFAPWMDREEGVKAHHDLEMRTIECEKRIIKVETKIEDIGKSVEDVKKLQYIILREVKK